MYRFSAALIGSACALSDETSLMQGMKPSQDVTQRDDKSKAISNLMSTATTLLKNGATTDVIEFAQATLSEITTVVLPAITDAHATDQTLVDNTFAMFETALANLEQGTAAIKTLNDAERASSVLHKYCRSEEEKVCYTKRECDYDLYAIWKRFEVEESLLRQLSGHVTDYFCAPDINGTLHIWREGAIQLFPPWIEQKPKVEEVEVEFGLKQPECETKFEALDDKTALCDSYQTKLENDACAHAHFVNRIREEFAVAWNLAISAYQQVVTEVHCLELDRWKEWRTLSTVQCLLDRTTERNGRPCDETTDEIVTEITHCEQIQYDTDISHLLIIYYSIPEVPPSCDSPPWSIIYTPGRCVPQPPHAPCSQEYYAQEYAELWIPPQPEFWGGVNFEEGNSHCNQRQDCVVCPMEPEYHICPYVFGGFGNEMFVMPEAEHECNMATQAQIAHNEWADVAPDALTCQLPVGGWARADGSILRFTGQEMVAIFPDGKQAWKATATCDDTHLVIAIDDMRYIYNLSSDRRTISTPSGTVYNFQ